MKCPNCDGHMRLWVEDTGTYWVCDDCLYIQEDSTDSVKEEK